MADNGNYWKDLLKKRYSRRTLLQAAAGAGAGYAGLSLLGCGGQQATPSTSGSTPSSGPKYGGTLTFGMYADAPDMDVHMQNTLPAIDMANVIYNGLLRIKTGGGDKVSEWEIVPELAEKWEQTDPITYVFKIREGLKAHDGVDFNAEDVKFSIERIATPQPQFIRNYMFEALSKVEATDKNTVKLTLKEPFAPLINYIANPWTKMAPKHVVDKEGDLKKVAIGTGPFKLKEYRRDVGWSLTKNPNYFIKGQPYLDNLELTIQPDKSTRLSNFRAGNLDILDDIAGLTGESAELLKRSNPNVTIDPYPEGAFVGLAIRSDRPPFDNVKVRQAVAMAIDHQQLISTVFSGDGFVQGVLPDAWRKWQVPFEKLGLPKKDIAKAKQLLAEAGYPNGFKTTGTTTANHPTGVDTWQVLKPQMKEIGIDVEPKILEFAAYQKARTNGDYDMAYIPLITYIDPEELLYPFFHSKGTRNGAKWADPKVDQLLEQQRRATNEAERKKVLGDLQIELAKQLWWIPLPQMNYRLAWHNYVKGFHSAYNTFYLQLMAETWLDK